MPDEEKECSVLEWHTQRTLYESCIPKGPKAWWNMLRRCVAERADPAFLRRLKSCCEERSYGRLKTQTRAEDFGDKCLEYYVHSRLQFSIGLSIIDWERPKAVGTKVYVAIFYRYSRTLDGFWIDTINFKHSWRVEDRELDMNKNLQIATQRILSARQEGTSGSPLRWSWCKDLYSFISLHG